MPGNWADSDRRQRLPPDWDARCVEVYRLKGHRCYVVEYGRRCPNRATQVDHVRRGDDHSIENLAPICDDCHGRKSSREGNFAKAQKRADISQRLRRTDERYF